MFGLGIGAFLIAVGFIAEWLLKKRLQNTKAKRFYMWVAWIFTALGAVLVAPVVPSFGISAAGAGAVSLAMLLVLGVDLVDRRPDWPAFFIIVALPSFMRWTGGPLGRFF